MFIAWKLKRLRAPAERDVARQTWDSYGALIVVISESYKHLVPPGPIHFTPLPLLQDDHVLMCVHALGKVTQDFKVLSEVLENVIL